MLHFFTDPYPNEIFYSTQGRLHHRSGNLSYKETLKEMYGSTTISASLYFPSNLARLQERLPQNTELTTMQIVQKHTLFPFFSSFLEEIQADLILTSMLIKDGRDIYNRAGIMAGVVKPPTYLRYCPLCGREDLEKYGELYWHREHQIGGIEICFKHEVWLNNSKVKVHGKNKHIASLASPEICRLDQIRYGESDRILHIYRRIRSNFESLLTFNYKRLSKELLSKQYKRELHQQGFASINGRVDQLRMREAFIQHFGEEFLSLLQSPLVNSENWLEMITRTHRRSFHPIRHLLMMDFLGLELDDIFTDSRHIFCEPFGKGPWLCLNPFCKNFEKHSIDSITITKCENTGKSIGTFKCECGFSYTRREDNKDPKQISRIKDFGQVWKEGLLSLVQTGKSYREIARELNVNVNTVIKYSRSNQKLSPILGETNSKDEGDHHKSIWKDIQRQCPELTKNQIRKKVPATYMFLYRNHKDWLNRNSPGKRHPNMLYKRVDWEARDNQILEEVKTAVRYLKTSTKKQIRVSVKSISDYIGKKSLLEKQLTKMPKTKAFIEETKESYEQFQKRRVLNVIHELYEDGVPLLPWRIKRKAGLKHYYPDLELEQAVDEFLESKKTIEKLF